MVIKRDSYLQKIYSKKGNGKVKIITGIRRCGKSYLLFQLYKERLISEGAAPSQFVEIALDQQEFIDLRNPYNLYDYVISKTPDANQQYYIFIDEIQLSYKVRNPEVREEDVAPEDRDLLYTTFYDILNGLFLILIKGEPS